jgi:hypothetical protein
LNWVPKMLFYNKKFIKDNNDKYVCYLMQNFKILLFAALLLSGFASIGSISSSVKAIPSGLTEGTYIFGPIAGLAKNETGSVDWIMVGNWRSNLANNTDTQNNQSSNLFNAAIEMIKSDGTVRHTHTVTDFVVLNVSQPDSNSTLYTGTSTLSLREGPVEDVPTNIQKDNDNNVFQLMIDFASVDYHFGDLPLYGISSNPEFMKTSDSLDVSPINQTVH